MILLYTKPADLRLDLINIFEELTREKINEESITVKLPLGSNTKFVKLIAHATAQTFQYKITQFRNSIDGEYRIIFFRAVYWPGSPVIPRQQARTKKKSPAFVKMLEERSIKWY